MASEVGRIESRLTAILLMERVVTAFCLWQSSDLLSAWQNAPYERGTGMIFLLWCAPLWLHRRTKNGLTEGGRPVVRLLTAGLLLTVLGSAGDLRLLHYLGMACALAAWTSRHRHKPLWIIASLLWMPVTGWVGSGLPIGLWLTIRLLMTGIAVVRIQHG